MTRLFLYLPAESVETQVELIKQWNEEAPDDKIICYSQWTSMIDSSYLHISPISMPLNLTS
jgi:hypothetical protein